MTKQICWIVFLIGTVWATGAQCSHDCDLPPGTDPVESSTIDNLIAPLKGSQRTATVQTQNCRDPELNSRALAQLVNSSLQTGLECLNKLGPARQKEAAKLESIVRQHTIRIECGKAGKLQVATPEGTFTMPSNQVAYGTAPNYPGFPKIGIDLEKTKGLPEKQRRKLLFHEMLHFLGFAHAEGTIDIPYLSESCCFGLPPESKEKSCEIMRKNLHPLNPAYTVGFFEIMSKRGSPSIAVLLLSIWLAHESHPF